MSIIKKYQPSKSNCKVTFSYPAQEGVNDVKILGDFNNWDPTSATIMKKSKSDFSASLELNLGQVYEFRYLINGNQWENDFSADKYVASPFVGIDNSVLIIEAAETKAAPKKVAAKTPATAKASVAKAPVAKAASATKVASATKAAPKKEAIVKTAPKATAETPVKATAKPRATKAATAKTTAKTAVKNDLKKI